MDITLVSVNTCVMYMLLTLVICFFFVLSQGDRVQVGVCWQCPVTTFSRYGAWPRHGVITLFSNKCPRQTNVRQLQLEGNCGNREGILLKRQKRITKRNKTNLWWDEWPLLPSGVVFTGHVTTVKEHIGLLFFLFVLYQPIHSELWKDCQVTGASHLSLMY